jgi:transposase
MAAAELALNAKDDRPLKLFFEDEGRFGRTNNVSRCWGEKGIRARVSKQIVRQYTYAYVSVCPETGESHALVMGGSTTEIMNYYLKDLSEVYRKYRIILCTDNAGWHVSKGLIVPDNIAFMYLPPYSPQLNPVEHIWAYIKENKGFNNKIFNSIEDVVDRLAEALNEMEKEKETIKSLCNFYWLSCYS